MRPGFAAGTLLFTALAATGCGYLTDDPEPYRPPVYYPAPQTAAGAGPVDPGRHLYLRDCASCHNSDGSGTSRGPDITGGTNGPALTDFVLRTGRMPVENVVDQMEAAEPVYDGGQIAAIVAYIRDQFRAPGPDIPDVDPARGDLAEGQQVYQEHCVSCHATTGIGGAMLTRVGPESDTKTKGIVIPAFENAEPRDVAEAVRTGPGSMPVFNTRAISDRQLDSLARYMLYLEDPRDEGGAPIGRVGPVVEGAVGWLLGLGTLMLVIRWIGTKAGQKP